MVLRVIERESLTRVVTFVDLAASTKSSADYTCIATVGLTRELDVVIINILRGRWEWPDSRRTISQEVQRQGVRQLGVEKVAFQLAAIQDLRRDPALLNVAIVAVAVDRDKVSRALPLAARAEAQKVYLARGDWNQDWIFEVCSFPGGAHDDQVDAVSGGIAMLTTPDVTTAATTHAPASGPQTVYDEFQRFRQTVQDQAAAAQKADEAVPEPPSVAVASATDARASTLLRGRFGR